MRRVAVVRGVARSSGVRALPASKPRASRATCRSAGTPAAASSFPKATCRPGRIGRLAESALRVAGLSRSAEASRSSGDDSSPRATRPTRRASSSSTNGWRSGSGPTQDPVGRRMVPCPTAPDDMVKPGPSVTGCRSSGVVRSVKLKGLVEGENARVGAYYLPYAQDPARTVGFAIRRPATTSRPQGRGRARARRRSIPRCS